MSHYTEMVQPIHLKTSGKELQCHTLEVLGFRISDFQQRASLSIISKLVANECVQN